MNSFLSRRGFIRSTSATALSFLHSRNRSSHSAENNRLNVLLITADDLGLQLGCYGETLINTPNLDALASRGVKFDIAYVAQASCSPSRSAMFTGLHTHSTGQYGLTNTGLSLHEHLQSQTIPNILQRSGYRTGIIGKLHVAPEESFQFDFEEIHGGKTREVRWVAEQAERFLNEKNKKPFFLMVNYSDPHAFRDPNDRSQWYFPPQIDGLPKDPLQPSEKTLFDFQGIDTPEQRIRTAGYYNAVQRLDDGIGMLTKVLEQHELFDNTLIIFVGDHGPPFARGKTTCYEAGLRVPFLLYWPGVSTSMNSQAMVSTIDILPTILDATGQPLDHEMHGHSLRPIVQKKSNAEWRYYLVGEFHFHGSRPFYPRRAIRNQRFKLIHNLRAGEEQPSTGIDGDPAYRISQSDAYEGTDVQKAFATFADPPEYELYDLEKDPIEFNNLAGNPSHQSIEHELKAALLEYLKKTNDPFLDKKFLKKMSNREE